MPAANGSPTRFQIVMRWLNDFDRAMEMRPIDGLEVRVAEVERRLATLEGERSDVGATRRLRSVGGN